MIFEPRWDATDWRLKSKYWQKIYRKVTLNLVKKTSFTFRRPFRRYDKKVGLIFELFTDAKLNIYKCDCMDVSKGWCLQRKIVGSI